MTTIRSIVAALAVLSGLTAAAPAQALKTSDNEVAVLTATLNSVTQNCTRFEANQTAINFGIGFLLFLDEEDQTAAITKMKQIKAKVIDILTKESEISFCERLYTERLGPTGANGKASLMWLMRRKS